MMSLVIRTLINIHPHVCVLLPISYCRKYSHHIRKYLTINICVLNNLVCSNAITRYNFIPHVLFTYLTKLNNYHNCNIYVYNIIMHKYLTIITIY